MTLTPQEFAAIEPHLWKASVTNPDVRACLDEIVRLRAEMHQLRVENIPELDDLREPRDPQREAQEDRDR